MFIIWTWKIKRSRWKAENISWGNKVLDDFVFNLHISVKQKYMEVYKCKDIVWFIFVVVPPINPAQIKNGTLTASQSLTHAHFLSLSSPKSTTILTAYTMDSFYLSLTLSYQTWYCLTSMLVILVHVLFRVWFAFIWWVKKPDILNIYQPFRHSLLWWAYSNILHNYYYFFWPSPHGILVPQPGIKYMPPTVGMQSLNYWIATEFLQLSIELLDFVLLICRIIHTLECKFFVLYIVNNFSHSVSCLFTFENVFFK